MVPSFCITVKLGMSCVTSLLMLISSLVHENSKGLYSFFIPAMKSSKFYKERSEGRPIVPTQQVDVIFLYESYSGKALTGKWSETKTCLSPDGTGFRNPDRPLIRQIIRRTITVKCSEILRLD